MKPLPTKINQLRIIHTESEFVKTLKRLYLHRKILTHNQHSSHQTTFVWGIRTRLQIHNSHKSFMKKFLSTCTALLFVCLAFAQQKTFTEKLDGIKTSGNELTKSSGTDNSSIGQSGEMSTSVPLVTVSSRTMSFPLQLHYSSGIEVDQQSGNVGLGWVMPIGSIVRDYGAFEPDYTATTNEVRMYNDMPDYNDGWIAPEEGDGINPFYNNQFLGYNGVDAESMTTAMSDQYHVSVPGFISNTFWNNGTPGGQHQWALTQYEQWKVAGSPKVFTISQEFSRINELNIENCTQCTNKSYFGTTGSFAAAIGMLPYVKNSHLYLPSTQSNGWNATAEERIVKYEDFGAFTITDDNGAVYVFGRALRGQKYMFSDDPYWSSRFETGNNANTGNYWKIDYIAEWLLTEIHSVDYVDLNQNGVADDGDAGDWIRFEYTEPTKLEQTVLMQSDSEIRMTQEVPMYREWSSFSQTDQASSLMREMAYLTKIVTPTQELDLTISQRMEVDHDYYSKPANIVGNENYYYSDRKYSTSGQSGSVTDFDVRFPVETMKYDTLKLFSKLIDRAMYPFENTLLSTTVLKYAAKGSTEELAVSSYLIRDNNNVDKLIDKPGDEFNITSYYNSSIKRGKTTLLGVEFYGSDLNTAEKTAYSFEYAYNPSYNEIHKRAIVNKFFFPSVRQGYNNSTFPDLRLESLMDVYQETVTSSTGAVSDMIRTAISPYEFLINFPYHERYYKLNGDDVEEIECFNNNPSLTYSEISHVLTPYEDVYGYYYVPGYAQAAQAWSLTKITYPTGGQVSFEYERGTFSEAADSPHWRFGENEVPMIKEYNALAKERSYSQDDFNRMADNEGYYDQWTKQKTLMATFEVDLPEYVGIRLKSRTVNDRINPVVVTNYAYGTGHMTSLPSDYVVSCISGFNSFIMRERLRHDWEKIYNPAQFQYKNDFDAKIQDVANSNIALDAYSSVHFYETTDVLAVDGSFIRNHYGAIDQTQGTIYPVFGIACTRLKGSWQGRYVIGGNVFSAIPVAKLKTELYAAGQTQPYNITSTKYSRQEILNKGIDFAYDLTINEYEGYPEQNWNSDEYVTIFDNTFELFVPIYCPPGSGNPCTRPSKYFLQHGWHTGPVAEDPASNWSNNNGSGNPKVFVFFEGTTSNPEPSSVRAQMKLPNNYNSTMHYEKWGSYVTRIIEEETNYKGMVTSKEFTYDPTHHYLTQEKTESLYAAEEYITTYEYAHEVYDGITTKFVTLNMLGVPCRTTTYLNSVANTNALNASFTTYDYSLPVPKPLDSYQYDATADHTTGTFTLVPFSITSANGSAWRVTENDIFKFNRTAVPVSARVNQVYTKVVAGNGLNTAKATIMSVERPFDATYTGFEDFSHSITDAQWTNESYLEEDWHTNEIETATVSAVISHSIHEDICSNGSSYENTPSVDFYHIVSVNDISNLEVGDQVTVSYVYNSTTTQFTSTISSIHSEQILSSPAPNYSMDHLLCFTNTPNIPAVNPIVSTSPTVYRFTSVTVSKQTPVYRLSSTYARTGEYSYKLPTIRTSGAAAKRSPIRPVKIDMMQSPAGCNTPTQEEGCYVNYKASLWLKYDKDIGTSPAYSAPIPRSSDAEGDAIYQRGEVNTTSGSVRIICKIWNTDRTSVVSTQTFYPESINAMWKQYTVDITALKGNQQWIEVYIENAISQVGVNILQLKSVFVDDIVVFPADGQYNYSVFDKFGNTTFTVNNDDVFTETVFDAKGRAASQKNEYGTVTGNTSYFDQVTNWSTQNNYVTQRSWIDNGLYNETRYYIDGFGKTKQVMTSDNIRNSRIVSETSIFDDRGRVERSYKPYFLYGAAFGQEYNDQYQQKTASFYQAQNAFTSIAYEATPDSKMLAKILPQADNESTAIVSQQSEYINASAITHPYMSGTPVFAPGTLIVNELIKPDGSKVKTYLDNLGRIIMEEHEIGFDHTQNSDGSILFGTTPQLSAKTWFVYDGAGRITEIYDPTGKKTEYYYNSLGLVVKSISPDRGVSEMRYDKYGQVRFTADANDVSAMSGNTNYDQFNYTKYDKWGRSTTSGVVTKPLNNASYPANNYFDDISSVNNQDFPVDGQPYTQLHIETSYGDERYIYNSNKPRRVYVYSEHVLNGDTWNAEQMDVTSFEYNADGQLNSTTYQYSGLSGEHKFSAVYNSMRIPKGKDYINGANNAYNHQWRTSIDNFGRPTHNSSIHNGVTTQTSKLYYDPIGNLLMRGIGTTGNSSNPHVDYHVIKKNIREQLVSLMTKKFRAGLTYSPNGNITNQYWSNEYFDPAGTNSAINQYQYTYDHMGRLLGADYKQSTVSQNPFAYFNNTSGNFPDDFGCQVNALNTTNALKDYFYELENSSESWAKDAANALNILKARYISGNVPHGVMTPSELDDFLRDYVRDCSTQKVSYRSLETYFAESNHDTEYIDSLTNEPDSVLLVKYARITLLEIPFITDEDCFPNASATVYGYLPDFPTPTASTNSTKYDEAYWYSGNGNISQLKRNDENGVKTVQQYTYGTAGSNRLTSVTWTVGTGTPFTHSYGYDANGNLLDDSRNNVTGISYNFFSDLPVNIENASGEYNYRYDGNGQRSVKHLGNHDAEYYIEGIVLNYDGKVKSYQTSDGYAEPNVNGSSVAYYYNVKDWMGTTRVVIDALGNTYNSVDYYPYGKKLPGRSVFVTGQEGYRYQFTGHEMDGETGYQYHGARYYNEELGKYMSVDPWASKFNGWSTYAYVLGNPVMLTDPTGKGPQGWIRHSDGSWEWDSSVKSQADIKGDGEYFDPGHTYHGADGNYYRLLDPSKGDPPFTQISKTEYLASNGVFVPGAFYMLGEYGWQESTMLLSSAVSAEEAATSEFIASQINAENAEEMMWLSDAAYYRAFIQPIEQAQHAQMMNQAARMQTLGGLAYELSPFSAVPEVADYIEEGSYFSAAGIAALEFTPWDEVSDVMRANRKAYRSFKRVNGPAGPGMDWHHLVEQQKSNVMKFGVDAIQNSDNLIRLDRNIHRKVTGHYNAAGPPGFSRNRDYIQTLNFAEQREYSLTIMRLNGWKP